MILNDDLLYSQISPSTSHQQRYFLQQEFRADAETTARYYVEGLSWTSSPDSSPLISRNPVEVEVENFSEPQEIEDNRSRGSE